MIPEPARIGIENPNFILNINEKRKVSFEISVPENAEPGGHYSVILFEPQLPSFYFKPGQPRTIPVVGSLFLLSVKTFTLEPEIKQKLEIVKFEIPREERIITLEKIFSRFTASVAQAATVNVIETSPSRFILKIKNNDIYHIKPFGKILIYNLFGKKVGEVEIPKKTILPGKTRQFLVNFSPEIPKKLKWLPASISNFLIQNFFIGKYDARLELQASSPAIVGLFQPNIPIILTFFSLPWKFWLGVIFILGLLISLLVKYQKRVKLSLKALLSRRSV